METKCCCGLHYEKFSTGLTYRAVYEMLWSGSDDPSTWRYKRRRTVLGFWRQLKQQMWDSHLHECSQEVPF